MIRVDSTMTSAIMRLPRQRILIMLCGAFALSLLYLNLHHLTRKPELIDPMVKMFSSPPRNTIVVARLSHEDTNWVSEELKDWDRAIYTVDNRSAALTVPMNKGREAMAYFTYLIDRYDHLPEISIFLHAHRDGFPRAWHTDVDGYDNVLAVRTLHLDFVKATGYVNLRCGWVPGCPDEIQPFRQEDYRVSEHHTAAAYIHFFGGDNSTIPERIGSACCSQFAVTKERILARPKSDYVKYRQWILDSELDDAISGRVMEYFWHIIFGKDPVDCPDNAVCKCDLYGAC